MRKAEIKAEINDIKGKLDLKVTESQELLKQLEVIVATEDPCVINKILDLDTVFKMVSDFDSLTQGFSKVRSKFRRC